MKFKLTKKFVVEILKFAVVGVVNTGVDLVIFKILRVSTGLGTSGIYFSLFKAISFLFAATNSYFMNKYWTFTGHQEKKRSIEVQQFLTITIIGWVINVVSSTAFVHSVPPHFGLSADQWASVAALFGTAIGLLWNFLGFRLFVFKPRHNEVLPPV